MAANKLYENHWELSEMYDNFELALRRLRLDITPLFTGQEGVGKVLVLVDEAGSSITTDINIEQQPVECVSSAQE
eukprot:3870702-Pyramimonas_sp.AAC.1